jgi:hypothetical protein
LYSDRTSWANRNAGFTTETGRLVRDLNFPIFQNEDASRASFNALAATFALRFVTLDYPHTPEKPPTKQ